MSGHHSSITPTTAESVPLLAVRRAVHRINPHEAANLLERSFLKGRHIDT